MSKNEKEFPPRGWVLAALQRKWFEGEQLQNCTLFFAKPGINLERPELVEYVSKPEVDAILAEKDRELIRFNSRWKDQSVAEVVSHMHTKKELAALEAKLAVAVEALGEIANGTGGIEDDDAIAREALARIKEMK